MQRRHGAPRASAVVGGVADDHAFEVRRLGRGPAINAGAVGRLDARRSRWAGPARGRSPASRWCGSAGRRGAASVPGTISTAWPVSGGTSQRATVAPSTRRATTASASKLGPARTVAPRQSPATVSVASSSTMTPRPTLVPGGRRRPRRRRAAMRETRAAERAPLRSLVARLVVGVHLVDRDEADVPVAARLHGDDARARRRQGVVVEAP